MNSKKAEDHHRHQLEHFIFVENCLIAEIHRISQKTPHDFINATGSRFSRLLTDFSYFENRQKFESSVDNSDEFRRLEDEFYSQFGSFLRSFHKLVDEICSLLFEFTDYAEKCQLNQNILDRKFVRLNSLKSDALFLLGVILLLIDSKFPGGVKERIFVAYYRSNVDLRTKHFELLVSLLRNRKEGFETAFPAVGVNVRFVEHVVNFLKNFAIAHQSEDAFFGEKQAAMMYVCLYFHPEVLHNQQATMRQIVDKYFQDRWVIPLHFELTANLVEKWARFRAANTVLCATLNAEAVSRKAADYGTRLRALTLPAGLLSIDQLSDYARLIFEYNYVLRWLILHSASDDAAKRAVNLPHLVVVGSRCRQDQLFDDFVKMAHFEHKFRQSCVFLVSHKAEEGGRLKARIGVLFDQIVQLLGNNLFESQTWNERLSAWMSGIRDCVIGLDVTDLETPQTLEHLVAKVGEVAEMHEAEQKILRQYLALVMIDMNKLRNVCLIDEEFVFKLDERRDACFIWDLLPSWSASLEALLKRDAVAVKFIFLKLSSSIGNALAGVIHAFPTQTAKLSEFYHRKLELHLRKIIQAIPRSIFDQMDSLHPLFCTDRSVHVEKGQLKAFANLERRRKLAKKTFEITKLSLGISSMCLSKLGPVEIRPKELLFNGLRKELRIKLGHLLQSDLAAPNVLRTLGNQSQKIATFREAFLFVCEHIGFNGVALWQAELEAVWSEAFCVEKANLKAKGTTTLTSGKGAAPRPAMGQIIHSLVQQTNPRTSVYVCMKDEWWNIDLRKLEFSDDFFSVVENWLPAIANVGLRRLVAFSTHFHTKTFLNELTAASSMFEPMPELKWTSVSHLLDSAEFLLLSRKLLDLFGKVGQLTIVEKSLSRTIEESLHARMEDVFHAAQNLLASLAVDRQQGTALDTKPFEQSTEFVSIVERLGLADRVTKPPGRVPHFTAFVLFGCLVAYLGSLSNKKTEFTDTFVVISGITAIARSLRVHRRFTRICHLLLPDASVLSTLRHLPAIHHLIAFDSMPEAFRR